MQSFILFKEIKGINLLTSNLNDASINILVAKYVFKEG